MKSVYVSFISALFIVLLPAASFAIGIEAAAGVWSHDPQGDLSYRGESLSVEDDLKYDNETKFMGRVRVDMPLLIPNIYLMATPVKFEETGSKTVSFTFGDNTFAAGTSFDSELQLDQYDFGFYYGIPFIRTASLGKFNVEAGLNVKIIDLDARVEQGSLSASKSFILPVPMVYVGAQFKPVDKFSVEAEIRGISYNSTHCYDLIGKAKYKIFGPAFIGAGYRYEKIKFDEKDVKVDVKLDGPFAEVGVEF